MRISQVIIVFVLLAAGCTSSESARTTTTPNDDPRPVPRTLPVFSDLPPPLDVEVSELDFAAFRQILGRWELVSFPGEPFSGTPRISFGHLQNARGKRLSYMAGWGGLCNSHGGEFLVDGDQLRVTGWSSTLMGCIPNDEDPVFSVWYARAETWSVKGDQLSITSVDGVTAVFQRSAHAPVPRPNGSDSPMDTVTPRLHFIDGTGFLVRIQEQSSADDSHEPRALNWIAWSSGLSDGDLDGFTWETASIVTPRFWNYQTRLEVVPDVFAPLVFEQRYAEPCFLADMNTINGTRPASLRYQNLTGSGVEVLVDEESSAKVNTGHADEMLGVLVAGCSSESRVGGVEIGRVEDLRGDWTLVDLSQSFVDPVVIAGPASLNDGDPGVVEVRPVSSSSFEIRFNEWDYLDGSHPNPETVSYVVVERGITVLPSGGVIETGTATATSTLSEVELTGDFGDITPVVVTTVLR